MKTMRTTMALLAGPSLLLVGCAAPPEAPAVDIAAEKAAVEQVVQDQLAGASQPGQAGADAYVATMTDDVLWLPPNVERMNGKEAVREWVLPFTSAEDWSPRWAPNQVVVAASGDVAYVVGEYEISWKDADGNPVSDKGKWMDGLKKQADGSWRISVGTFNSDLPVAGTPAATE